MAKHRADRINEEVMRELAGIIRELKDPRIPVMTSVVRVSVTPDLKYARAHISVLGDAVAKKACIQGLQSAGGFIRREISRRVNLRATPEFTFVSDDSLEHGAHIANVLKGLSLPDKGEEDGETEQQDN